MNLKYIILVELGIECPIVFPEIIDHIAMVPFGRKAISAGFCEIADAGAKVFGISTSLKLSHRPEDEEILNQFFKVGPWKENVNKI